MGAEIQRVEVKSRYRGACGVLLCLQARGAFATLQALGACLPSALVASCASSAAAAARPVAWSVGRPTAPPHTPEALSDAICFGIVSAEDLTGLHDSGSAWSASSLAVSDGLGDAVPDVSLDVALRDMVAHGDADRGEERCSTPSLSSRRLGDGCVTPSIER